MVARSRSASTLAGVIVGLALAVTPLDDLEEVAPPCMILLSVGEQLNAHSVAGGKHISWKDAARRYLMSHWHLPSGDARTVVAATARASEVYQLDPMLLLAIAAVESSFRDIGNPDGGDDPRQPYGIMQVAGAAHPELFPGGVVRPTSVDENILIGAGVLRGYLDRANGDVRQALRRYNATSNDVYFNKVNRMSDRIRAQVHGPGSRFPAALFSQDLRR